MCIAGLGVCAAGWVMVIAALCLPEAATASGTWDRTTVTILGTGAGLALAAAVTFACWAVAWRRVLRADGVLHGEARRRSRRRARRRTRQAARAARLQAAVARREARRQAPTAQMAPDPNTVYPDANTSYAEPDAVRPPNADRVLAQLRDLLGPLITALDAESPDPAVRPAPAPPRAPAHRAADDLVAVCADGVICYDSEEAW